MLKRGAVRFSEAFCSKSGMFFLLDFDKKSRMRVRKTLPTETATAAVDSGAVLHKTRERNNKIKISKSLCTTMKNVNKYSCKQQIRGQKRHDE